jgi:beta-xylosidase
VLVRGMALVAPAAVTPGIRRARSMAWPRKLAQPGPSRPGSNAPVTGRLTEAVSTPFGSMPESTCWRREKLTTNNEAPTTNITDNYPYATSEDLVTWEPRGDAMPRLPAWANGNPWAPEVTQTSAGYVMYFTARAAGVKRPDGADAQCVGVAVGDTPDGPFVDDGAEPLVCQVALGGTIDASIVRDVDGSLWLIYKNDGNCCAMPTRLYMRPMSEDGLTFAGKEVEVDGIVNDQEWEGGVVEAPTIHHHDGTYYLFYSGNNYRSADYAVGYATATSLTGPYADAEENPILASGNGAIGPGHQALAADPDGDLWMVYHAWSSSAFLERNVWIDELRFDGGRPVVDGPDLEPQPMP